MPENRDPYEVLGLGREASSEEINKAFKKLGRKYHPDKNPGDPSAEAMFKEVQNAYDTLSDPKKREMFDRFGHTGPMPGPGGGGSPFGGGGVDPEQAQDIFNRFFGQGGGGGGEGFNLGDMFGGGARKRRPGSPRRTATPAQDVEAQASIPFLTVANGGTVTLELDGRTIDVNIPAGIEDNKTLRVKGQGPGGGNILVRVRVEPHPYFRREGRDVLIDVPLSVTEAILGGKVEVPTVNGKRVDVKIRPGTSGGTRLRLPGFGMAGGDMFLTFKVMVPKTQPDERTRQLVEEYATLNPLDARADVPWKSGN